MTQGANQNTSITLGKHGCVVRILLALAGPQRTSYFASRVPSIKICQQTLRVGRSLFPVVTCLREGARWVARQLERGHPMATCKAYYRIHVAQHGWTTVMRLAIRGMLGDCNVEG